MTVFTLGEATALVLDRIGTTRPSRQPSQRTGAPVRRGSIEAGTFEDMFFVAPAKGEADRMLRAARCALDAGRRLKRAIRAEPRELSASERALIALTAGAIRVYEEICTLARLNDGRVFPSYDWLAQATALGRATIARALTLLETAGFLVRQRRFKRVDKARASTAPGPRYEQTSNAYRPTLPRCLMVLLPRWLRPAPPPVDAEQHAAEQTDTLATMHASLSARELATATVQGPLGRMLARLGAAIDVAECESRKHPEPLKHVFI